MSTNPQAYSRRDFFASLFRMKAEGEREEAVDSCEETLGTSVAVVQGRFCLAYQNSFCSVCSERCPEPGAIVTQRGIPRVVADACTGCGVCRDVCPAPRNAILMMRPPERRARRAETVGGK